MPPSEPDDASGGEPGPPGRHPADETMRTGALPDEIRCPHCGEEESEQFAAFGSAVSVSQYWCRSCRTVFEAFKWR
jgi:transposase-like protein